MYVLAEIKLCLGGGGGVSPVFVIKMGQSYTSLVMEITYVLACFYL